MKAAVLGGSGFIGRNLVAALACAGHDVIVVSRRPAAISAAENRITARAGDVHDITSLNKALSGADLVYHLVGIIAETRQLTFQKTVEQGTANIVAACRDCGIRKILYLSAAGTEPNATTKYFQSKWRAEELIRSSELNYLILRPSLVYGPEDKSFNRLARLIRYSPIVPIIGRGDFRLQPVYIRDLITVMASYPKNLQADGKTLELGGPESYTLIELIEIFKKVLNKKRAHLYIPLRLLKWAAVAMEKLISPAPLTVDQLEMLQAGNVCNNDELLKYFDIKPTRLENGLREYLR